MAGSVVVDLKRMDRVGPVDRDARTVRCEPGVLGQHLEDRLATEGFMTAHSPSSIMCSTVGGYVAARSAGQFSSRYGVFHDMLLAAQLETPQGRLRTGTWTAPGEEDLLPVVCGSEGALGVVSDTLIRVVALPETRWLRGYAFPSLEDAWAAMRALMQSGTWPSVLRLYDPVDTRIGGPAKKAAKAEARPRAPTVLDRLRTAVHRVPSLRHHLLDLPLSLPGLVNRIASGLGDEVLMVVGFEGETDEVNAAISTTAPIFEGARDLGAAPGEYWFAHRHEVSFKLAPIFVGGGWADTMEVAATWSQLGDLHDRVREAIGEHAIVMAHFSHAYPEGCSIYFSFAGSGRMDVYDAVWEGALAAALGAGCTVTHHHGVGPLKAAAAAREAGAAVRVWKELKHRFDPSGVMNPGRLFPSTGEPTSQGPPAPEGGPVFAVDAVSGLAQVDPHASIPQIEAALAESGHAFRFRPDRPLLPWLQTLRKDAMTAQECPLFALQARFQDGCAVRLGGAPRSAAGPDLRWPLLRRATIEMVEVPVVAIVEGAPPPAPRTPDTTMEDA